jgi:twitching motility protein PilT
MSQATEQGVKINLHQLLRAMIEKGASDMHITTGSPPLLRIDGAIVPLKLPPLSPVETKQLCYSVLTEEQKIQFEKNKELDLSFGVKNLSRFRANIFVQRGAVSGAFRTIPFKILSFDELGLPLVVASLAEKPRGLVLVTGPTGSGKSTTLASILDKVNSETRQHIITIEDPIEYLHPHKRCIVNQREVGADTGSFKGALKYVLRQDPDVVLVGEMRDLETVAIAIETAETGHLVFGTLHTTTAASTIDRIIDQFPADRQGQIRTMLSESLRGVIAQVLCKKSGGGRVAAFEILLTNAAVANLIREAKSYQLVSVMQTGRTSGMQTLNEHLLDLVTKKQVEAKEAYVKSNDKTVFRELLQRTGITLNLDE